MPSYKAPLRDINFCIKELFDYKDIQALPGYEDMGEDLVDAVLTEAARICEDVLAPINQSGDLEGCRWENGQVFTPKGIKEAYNTFVEGSWTSLAADPAYGGQGLPESIGLMTEEMICGANTSFSLYPGLTRGASILLHTHGSDELKDRYLPKMINGTWGGTMCLTESHCGTDLGLLRTKAEPQGDGSYLVTGTKIFISSGEHDLTDNIIHFVLAKTPDAPAGIKGVSLFVVPKIWVNDDGSLGDTNGVTCASIEHKMGIRASATCVMNFENAKGYLVGKLFHGVSNMFAMMNAERLGVGNQGLGVAEVAYQNALAYARDRLQGRALTGVKFPEKPADPITVHPDVRRMLLTMKAYNEGNRMVGAWIARALDVSHKEKDPVKKQEAEDLVQLMTPVVKAFFTDCGYDVANMAMQVLGGHGYIKEYGLEQFARDARISQIYEGTNGVQALDFVGRKLPANTGRYLRQFFHPVLVFIEENKDNAALAEMIPLLVKAVTRLQQATSYLAVSALRNPDEAGAASVDYLRMFALVTHAYLWAKAVKIAAPKVSGEEGLFYESKLETARFFYTKLLPQTSSLLATIMAGAKPLMSMKEEGFGPF
ncbi:MAG: acyl-CoA dehydrogenase C-terminal domain-containing protein [Proteobacteria bacterium]|nr:acyl-CoA dehydrogenase C-terminal domain-containing protein [Pseudomonadota bacterium]